MTRRQSSPPIASAILWLLLGVLCFAGGCSSPSVALFGTQKPNVRATPEIASLERAMFQRLNRDRQKAGLPPLTYDEALADVGRAHSFDMREHGFFAHESPNTGVLEDRMDRAGILAAEMRENLATAEDVERAEDNLLKSPGHRRNILADSVTHVGIGIVQGDGSGDPRMLLITQVFARPAKLATPAETEVAVLAAIDAARARRGVARLTPHPMLTELAGSHIESLPDTVPDGAVGDIGVKVSRTLNERDDHELMAIQILAQAVFNAGEFTVPDSALAAKTGAVGVAARKAVDERGRPRVKVLVLLGRR